MEAYLSCFEIYVRHPKTELYKESRTIFLVFTLVATLDSLGSSSKEDTSPMKNPCNKF